MNIKVLKHRIGNFERELDERQCERSTMLGGSLLSDALDRRILWLIESIDQLSKELSHLRWETVCDK